MPIFPTSFNFIETWTDYVVIECNDHVIACNLLACNGHVMLVIVCNDLCHYMHVMACNNMHEHVITLSLHALIACNDYVISCNYL